MNSVASDRLVLAIVYSTYCTVLIYMKVLHFTKSRDRKIPFLGTTFWTTRTVQDRIKRTSFLRTFCHRLSLSSAPWNTVTHRLHKGRHARGRHLNIDEKGIYVCIDYLCIQNIYMYVCMYIYIHVYIWLESQFSAVRYLAGKKVFLTVAICYLQLVMLAHYL